ncbi:MAG: helix-turn-helix domain-containing protein [Micrococcales bacterium]|nr:helix-turn-helix domain-containing protein [Micrococcales bacterium]
MSLRPRQEPSRDTARALDRSAGDLATAAARQMETHEWYRELPAGERSWVGLVAQAGISEFLRWLHAGGEIAPSTASIFAIAPQELTRSVSLRQTIDLVRTVVDVVESRVELLAAPGDEQLLRESVLRFSREIAFGTAEVYAGAAEARGAWDARLEALVVDAVLRGEADESIRSRASALGWGQVANVTFVVGQTPPIGARPFESGATVAVDRLRRSATQLGVESLAIVQRNRLITIIGGTEDPLSVVRELADCFAEGPVVVGPTVPHLFAAGRSARAALSGLAASTAWPDAPRVVTADELLPERALDGDQPARRILIERIHRPLTEANQAQLLDTAQCYLEVGGSLEATARALFVHANTVRYRLGRISMITGYDLTTPRDAWSARVGLGLGRLVAAERATARHQVVRQLEESSNG